MPGKKSLGPIIAEALRKAFGVGSSEIKLPNIYDYTEEAITRRRIEALKKVIERKRKFSVEDLLEVSKLKREGKSSRQIAKKFNCSHTAILAWLRKIKKSSSLKTSYS
jgi:DNA invertase Pin-like site-specific DNA recombinase